MIPNKGDHRLPLTRVNVVVCNSSFLRGISDKIVELPNRIYQSNNNDSDVESNEDNHDEHLSYAPQKDSLALFGG